MRKLLACCVIVGSILSGCSGRDSGTSSTAPHETVDRSRPSGDWVLVRWTTKRSDGVSADGSATELWLSIRPVCANGPCALKVEPNGADGSFSPVDTGNSTGSAKEGYTLNWNSKAARYEQTFGPERGDCTTKDGQVPGGYRSKTTLTLQ